MSSIVELLTDWGLEEYKNDIDFDVLNILDDNGIKDLIPSVGNRARFKNNLREWKSLQTQIGDSIAENFLDLDTTTSLRVAAALSEIETTNLILSPTTGVASAQPSSKTSTELTDIHTSDELLANNNVYKILQDSLDGRAILKEGKTSGGLLKENYRRRLSQILIFHHLEDNPSRQITTADFYRLASEICGIFPKESAVVYYSAYLSATSHYAKKNASGKLYETYISRRRALRLRGDLPATSRSSRNSSVSSSTTRTISPVNSNNIDYTIIEEKLTWLRNNLDPWQSVEDNWIETSDYRLKPIISGQGNIAEYFREFPAIQQPLGYTLLMKDFCHLYPNKENELFSNILLHRENILKFAKVKLDNIRDKYIKKTIAEYISLADENDSEAITNIALILLAYVISISPCRKKKGKENWKPSRSEIRDGYVTQAASESDVSSILQTRREKMTNLGRTLQPLVIFVGESIAQVRCVFIAVNNTLYRFQKLVTAVDAAFKIFHATGACYPEESADIWLVIQIGFYNIRTKFDRPTQAVNSLLSDLGFIDN